MMKRESIRDILINGGSVEVPFKLNIKDWFSTMRITCPNPEVCDGSKFYLIEPLHRKFSDIDDAVDWFMANGVSSKNIGYIQSRLSNKGVDFEYVDSNSTNDMIEKESKVVDDEFNLMGIKLKPLPSKKKAIEEAKKINQNISIENLSQTLTDFENKYLPLDPYINLSFIYEYDNNGEVNRFESKTDHGSFNRSVYIEHLNRPDIKYKNIKITIKVGGSEYISHNLNF